MARLDTEDHHVVFVPETRIAHGHHQWLDVISFPLTVEVRMLEAASGTDAIVAEEDMLSHLLRIGAELEMGLADGPAEGLAAIYDARGFRLHKATPAADAERWSWKWAGIFTVGSNLSLRGPY